MTYDPILERVDKVNTWSRGPERAPHKPLLLLLALGRLSQGKATVLFADCEHDLTRLLREFGPPRKSYHPEYPFWRLQRDGLWQLSNAPLGHRKSNTDPTKGQLRSAQTVGGFPDAIRQRLQAEPALVTEMAQRLLSNFPEPQRQKILDAVGLRLEQRSVRTRVAEAQLRPAGKRLRSGHEPGEVDLIHNQPQTEFAARPEAPSVQAGRFGPSSDEPITPRHRHSRVQGYEPHEPTRRAIEHRAMQLAEAHYRKKGFEVENTADREPYDFRCTREGLEVRVEVKGTRGDGEAVEVTSGEVDNARGTGWRTDLFVVSGIEIEIIADVPVARGGKGRQIQGWRPTDADLTAIRFRCVVPKRGR